MRPRNWVRIQNLAVPDALQLSNTSAQAHTHTHSLTQTHTHARAHRNTQCTPHLGQLWRQRSPWLPDARLLRRGGGGSASARGAQCHRGPQPPAKRASRAGPPACRGAGGLRVQGFKCCCLTHGSVGWGARRREFFLGFLGALG